MALKPRRFDWKDGKGQDKKNVAGFIAQEFQQVLPNCVKEESTGVLRVDTDNLTWYLINAVKELKATVDAQAARIAVLEGAK